MEYLLLLIMSANTNYHMQ